MKRFFWSFLVLMTVFTSCGDGNNAATEAPVTVSSMDSEVIKSVAKIYVTGMTCKAGCGGKIEKELQALNGVKGTETLFEENRAENIVSVEFDPALMDTKSLEGCVEKIMDGKYLVSKIEVINYKGLQSHGSGGAGVSEDRSAFSDLFKLLNVFQSLGHLIGRSL
jgi:copper chaperone CopZ